jgi:hypothetical protein
MTALTVTWRAFKNAFNVTRFTGGAVVRGVNNKTHGEVIVACGRALRHRHA